MFTMARLFYNNYGDTVYYNRLKQLRLHLTRNSLLILSSEKGLSPIRPKVDIVAK